jgi:hypothetical protein
VAKNSQPPKIYMPEREEAFFVFSYAEWQELIETGKFDLLSTISRWPPFALTATSAITSATPVSST